MVEYTGKRSAASVIKTLLGIAFYLGLVAGAAVIGWQVYLLAAEPAWLKEGMELQIETPGLELKGNLRFEDLIGGILTGLIVLVLAEVFSYGARLQEEQDFTV